MYIEKYGKTIIEWRFTPMANYACPVFKATKNEANSPRGLAFMLYLIYKGRRDYNEIVAERVYQCNQCLFCTEHSLDETDPAGMIIAARADVVERGMVPVTIMKFKDYITSKVPSLERIQFFERKGEVGYFVDPLVFLYHPETVNFMISILEKAGVSFGVIGAKEGSGAFLFEMGFLKEAQRIAEKNLDIIKKCGYKTIIFSSPHDYSFFKNKYKNITDELNVLHVSEYILGLAEDNLINIKEVKQKKIAYYDPCTLARGMRVYEAPRKLLGKMSNKKLLEVTHRKDKTNCCGGAILSFTYPGIARNIAQKRIKQFKDIGAKIVITSCPYCKRNFLSCNKENDIEVKEIAEFVSEYLEK